MFYSTASEGAAKAADDDGGDGKLPMIFDAVMKKGRTAATTTDMMIAIPCQISSNLNPQPLNPKL